MKPKRLHLADLDLDPSPLNRPPRVTRRRFVDYDDIPKRVCIYAAGMYRELAPLDDPDWSVWALNVIPPVDSEGRLRADLWWEIHEAHAQSVDDMMWIAKCPVPIVVPPDLIDASPNAVHLPLVDLLRRFPGGPFACTFAYQIAFAILAGVEELALFGMELCYGSPRERTVEWASVNYWIGYAEATGMKVVRPPATRLGSHPFLYGVDYDAEIESTNQYLDFVRRMARGLDDG